MWKKLRDDDHDPTYAIYYDVEEGVPLVLTQDSDSVVFNDADLKALYRLFKDGVLILP